MKPFAYFVTLLYLGAPHFAVAQSPFEFYGQVNLGLFRFNDGTDSDTAVLDNDNSNTRIGLWYRNELSNGATLKFNIEGNIGLEKTSDATIGDNDFEINPDRTDWRYLEAIYETPQYGTFYLGQGSMAADATAQADFSGTSVITYVGLADLAGSMQFRERNQAPSSTTVGQVFGSYDFSRRLRARYDTPSFKGFNFSAAYGQEWLDQSNDSKYADVAARYIGAHGAFKLEGRLGYQWIDNDKSPNERLLTGSGAVLHTPSGFSAAFASGAADESDAGYVYGKLGYQQDWFSIGTSYLSLDYYDGEDFSVEGSDSKSWSVAAVQAIDRFNMEIYAAYRSYDLDAIGTDFEDIKVYAFGARWKF